MNKLALTLVGFFALAAASGVGAHTQEENVNFINMIISFLNNRETCILPTYSEIDSAFTRFDELKQQLGPDGFNDDQVLLRETVLDQWDSFQKYLTSKNVLRPAKRRSFLARIGRYQDNKFGESICSKKPDTRVLDDPEFEKNPLLRYNEQFGRSTETSSLGTEIGSGVSSSGSPASEHLYGDVELKFKLDNGDASGNI